MARLRSRVLTLCFALVSFSGQILRDFPRGTSLRFSVDIDSPGLSQLDLVEIILAVLRARSKECLRAISTAISRRKEAVCLLFESYTAISLFSGTHHLLNLSSSVELTMAVVRGVVGEGGGGGGGGDGAGSAGSDWRRDRGAGSGATAEVGRTRLLLVHVRRHQVARRRRRRALRNGRRHHRLGFMSMPFIHSRLVEPGYDSPRRVIVHC